MHAQILGNQINNTILLKHKLKEQIKELKIINCTYTVKPNEKEKKIFSFFQRLQEEGKKKKKLSPYEKLRNETIDFFDSLFR